MTEFSSLVPHNNSSAEWLELSSVADMIVSPILNVWREEIKTCSGVDLLLINVFENKLQSILTVGEMFAPSERLLVPLKDRSPGEAALVFYGAVSKQDQRRLATLIHSQVQCLFDFYQKTIAAASFDLLPLIAYQAAEIDGRWVLCQANEALEEFFSIPVSQFIGGNAKHRIVDFVHPDDFDRLMSAYDYTRMTSKELTLQYRLKNGAGQYIPVTERVHYSKTHGQRLCNSVVWHRSLEQVDSQQQFELFKGLEVYIQDVSFETGRGFLQAFCRRLATHDNIKHVMLASHTKNDWWESLVMSTESTSQPNFHFKIPDDISVEQAIWNQSLLESESECFVLPSRCYAYQSILPVVSEFETEKACLFFGSDKPIENIDQILQFLRFLGVRLLKELAQIRIAEGQESQNLFLARQKNQLTQMVTLLGNLDTSVDERQFFRTAQSHLIPAFYLEGLNWFYWTSGEWFSIDWAHESVDECFNSSSRVTNAELISELEAGRRENKLQCNRTLQQVSVPVGYCIEGYVVAVLSYQSYFPDLNLLEFSFNALSLSLQGLIQRENLNRQVMTDSLTHLGNRVQLHAWMRAMLPVQTQASLLLFDLNRFKEINDSFGHQFGDKLLCEIGPRISSAMANQVHYLARLGGDEFALFLPDISPDRARLLAEKLHSVLAESYLVDRIQFQVQASIGIAHFPHHGRDGHELLRCSDVAMYAAKRSGRAVVEFETNLDTTTPLRIAVLSELENALASNQLRVVYQPIMSTQTGRAGGMEALVRWEHPEFGHLSPDEFIPIAEMGEGIRKITEFVLRRTLQNLTEWRTISSDFHVAVNISPRVLLDLQFPILFENMLEEYNLPGESVIMELTESTLLVDPIRAVEIINALGDLGIKTEIDDYGTGYSSLAYIKSLPITSLKIDRSFVTDLLVDPQSEVIVSSTVKMAQSLGLQTVAEGVEDKATCDKMIEIGCDFIQGYYYSRPLEESDVSAWLSESAE